MNVLRGLFGKSDRGRDHKREYTHQHPQFETPPAGPPPQYSYNPLVNTLAGGLNYLGRPRDPLYGRPPLPPQGSGLLGLSSPLGGLLSAPLRGLAAGGPLEGILGQRERPLGYRDSPLGYRDAPLGYRERPPGVRDRLPAEHEPRLPPKSPGQNGDNDDKGIDKEPKEYKTAYHNWPRIFTAMGSSVDAVAGGIHALRKEVSKMTGQTIAKGLLMGGTAVHEVSKGVATVVTKMSHL